MHSTVFTPISSHCTSPYLHNVQLFSSLSSHWTHPQLVASSQCCSHRQLSGLNEWSPVALLLTDAVFMNITKDRNTHH